MLLNRQAGITVGSNLVCVQKIHHIYSKMAKIVREKTLGQARLRLLAVKQTMPIPPYAG